MTTWPAPDPGLPTGAVHLAVGAYVLGVLEPAENAAFEGHLAGCPQCTEEVRQLESVQRVLAEYAASTAAAGLDPAGPLPMPGGRLLDRLVAEVRAGRRRGRIRRLALALTATAMIAAGPAVTAAVLTAENTPSVVAVAEQFSATDPTTGAKATVGINGQSWGSQISLQLSGVHGPLTCRLVAVSHGGEHQTVTTWSVPAGGYDEPDNRETLRTTGGAALQPHDIDHFEVRVQGTDALLVSVPAHKA
ncbi:zf-HC2 domain-containing protein [Kitasatospora aureofaciens]|uniref:anti-sigma factor n=1 Tax=Kitasatospora aureofaciens TaxID=1894 RepID=UPI000689AD12|nr:zf-HC2 domain-containing protein [Streptomyces viridifaciens]